MDDPKAHVGHAIGKMTAAFYAAGSGRASSVNWQNTNLTSVVASAPERQDIRVGGGFLSVVFIRSLDEVPGFIRESDQTITYFGWERGEIEAVAPSRDGPRRLALGADRDGARLRFHLGRLRYPVRADAAHPRLLRSRLLAQNQRPVALLDADQAFEKALPEQIHLAGLGRENQGLDIVHIEAVEADAPQNRGRMRSTARSPSGSRAWALPRG